MTQTKAQLIDGKSASVEFSSGAAGTPSITFSGDTNTGLFNPVADTLAISTNGSQRVTVNSSGNVGIGTTNPGVPLEVNGLVLCGRTDGSAYLINRGGYSSSSVYSFYGNDTTGISNPAAGQIGFLTSGGERARIDSSGRLLVGTSTARSNFFNQASTFAPQMQLEGVGSAGQAMLSITSGDSIFGPYLNLARQKSGAVGGNTAVSNNDVLGNITFQGSDGTEFVAGAEISAAVDGTPGANDMPGRLVFSTCHVNSASQVERLRIDSNGTTKAKGSTTTNAFAALQAVNSADALLFSARNDGAIFTGLAGQSPYNLTTANPSNVVVESNGFLYRSTSSLKYKKEVSTATHGLAELLQLRSVTYKGIGESDGEKVFGGLIAEEVHEVGLTEFVQYSPDGQPDALAYSNMVSLCIKAIQEQQAMITELQAEVAALKAQ